MKKSTYIRFSMTLLVLFSMLSPTAVMAAGDGKKHFKKGLNFEASEEWDAAVEEFAMAVAENPKNPEYRLHYQRALFFASQMFMKKGNAQANEKDYAGAYISFRKAYGYDPVNELAKSEMERMLRLQKELDKGAGQDAAPDGVKLVPTSYKGGNLPDDVTMPQRLEKLRDVPFPNSVDLMWLIKELSKDLDLNVLFDTESRLDNRKVKIELKNVTAAKALDYLFLQENLFFQKVGPRTILIAGGNRRQNYQQLVLRTFYLANGSPKDVANVVKTAIPAQPGRTPTIVLTDDATNSITIRDTSENIRLIGKLITSLDKDRAEVVMDVQIYEVSKTDLLKLGNQIGTAKELSNLGGVDPGVVLFNGEFGAGLPTSIASGFLVPSSVISAFQLKTKSKLLASTQIHAFNNEDSSARIGQRVPVRSASFAPVGTTSGGTNNFVGDVINYEQTGLTLKFKPLVFPNQDVQVVMEIESKDVIGVSDRDLNPTFTERVIKGTARIQNNKTLLLASVASGVENDGRSGLPLISFIPILGRLFSTPTNESKAIDVVIAVTPRVIRAPAILPEDLEERETGSLAVPTSSSLEAMVMQEEIEEQLASARRLGNNAQIQLPDLPLGQPTYVRYGTSATAGSNARPYPTMNPPAYKTNKDDATASVKPAGGSEKGFEPTGRSTPDASKSIQLDTVSENRQKPEVGQMRVVEAGGSAGTERSAVSVENGRAAMKAGREQDQASTTAVPFNEFAEKLLPIDSSVKTLQIEQIADMPTDSAGSVPLQTSGAAAASGKPTDELNAGPGKSQDIPRAELRLLPGTWEMRSGEKTTVAVIFSSADSFRSAILGLKFDPKKTAVRRVGLGDLFGETLAHRQMTPFLNKDGRMVVTLSVSKDVGGNSSGVLAYIVIEALTDGPQVIGFDSDTTQFLTSGGKDLVVKF